MKQASRARTGPALVFSLAALGSLYIFTYCPLVFLFQLEKGGVLQGMVLVGSVLQGVILAAVVHMLLEPETVKPYAVLTAVLYLAFLVLSWVLVSLFHDEYDSPWALLLQLFPQAVGLDYMLPGVALHMLSLLWLHRRQRTAP